MIVYRSRPALSLAKFGYLIAPFAIKASRPLASAYSAQHPDKGYCPQYQSREHDREWSGCH
jgi:hypothetical protein